LLELVGYVRNLPDGGVEVAVEGSKSHLQALINHLRVGPPGASVDEIDVDWSEWSGQYQGFVVRR
jgi:acylphosphatase